MGVVFEAGKTMNSSGNMVQPLERSVMVVAQRLETSMIAVGNALIIKRINNQGELHVPPKDKTIAVTSLPALGDSRLFQYQKIFLQQELSSAKCCP